MKRGIDNMICKNCKHYEDGLCNCNVGFSSVEDPVKVSPTHSCADFDESADYLYLGDLKSHPKKYLKKSYLSIIEILKKYMDLKEQEYSLVALWIIGTYFHDEFLAYPYLFFNAMKKSGKSRILKLVATLSKNGKVLVSMSEAVLFRTAINRTLCIDELEDIGSKEKRALRELLNAAYKKGITVERLKPTKEGSYEVEQFDVYCPIAMANIWGMDEVLGDRCISLILERSSDIIITKLIEDFEENPQILDLMTLLKGLSVVSDIDVIKKQRMGWNAFIQNPQKELNDTNNTNDTNDTNDTTILYNKINNTNISGRDLELFFPLFILANLCGKKILSDILETAVRITKERQETDRDESRDVQLIDFISQRVHLEFISVSKLTNEFRDFIGAEPEDKWLNSKWVGRALRRLSLVKEKHRTGRGREVRLDIEKARDKIRMFKEPEEVKVVKIK